MMERLVRLEFTLAVSNVLFRVGAAVTVNRAPHREELLRDRAWFPAPAAWGFLVRWVCPAGIGVIIAWTFASFI